MAVRSHRGGTADFGARLRRLDWRFLLPDAGAPAAAGDTEETEAPDAIAGSGFEDVVFVGGSDETAELAKEIGLAKRVGRRLGPASADAVIVFADGWARPEEVAGCLRPSGVLYWEVDRTEPARVAATPRRFARRLRRAGLLPVGAFGCLPDFENCRLYLPLDAPAALDWYISTRFPVFAPWRRLLVSALRLATDAKSDRTGPLFPYYALTAVAGTSEAPAPALLAREELVRAIGEPVKREDAAGIQPLILTGTGNRVAMLPFHPEENRPRGVLKVPKLPSMNARTEHEHDVLSRIRAGVRPDLRESIPRPLARFQQSSISVAVESYLAGRSMLVSSGRWGGGRQKKLEDLKLASEWLEEFHSDCLVRRTSWDSETMQPWVEEPISSYHDAFGTTAAEQRLFEGVKRLGGSLAGRSFPVVWQHRDYNVWNIFRDEDRLAVIDWEGARPGPPLCDLLHFVTHWHETIRYLRTEKEQIGGLRSLFFVRPDGTGASEIPRAVHDTIEDYMARLELDEGFLPLLLVLHWVELALSRRRQQVDMGGKTADPRDGNRNFPFIRFLARHTEELFSPGAPWEGPGEQDSDDSPGAPAAAAIRRIGP